MSSVLEVPKLKLNNGVEIPALGFGTFAKEGIAGRCYRAVLNALDAGYRHLDCAFYYQNEEEVGAALRDWLARNPTLQRSDIFITTKVWPHLMKPEDVEWSLRTSLKNLELDYVDAFLIHWPFACERTEDHEVKLDEDGKYILKPFDLPLIWRTFEQLHALGLARTIGVSNFRISDLTTLLPHCIISPALNQIELHPFLPSDELISFLNSKGILPVAYSPLGSQHQCFNTGEKLMNNGLINEVAQKKGVSVAQVLIAWGLQKGYGVIPKSGDEQRIIDNFASAGIKLTNEEVALLDDLPAQRGGETRFVHLVDTFGFDFFAGEHESILANIKERDTGFET